MTPTENARSDAGAVSKFGGFGSQYNRTTDKIQHQPRSDSQRFERMVERLHRLGPRPTAELLNEIMRYTGQSKFIADRLQAYAALDPEIVRAVGGDRFPPMPLEVVR